MPLAGTGKITLYISILGGGPGTGGYSLTCRQPHADCAVADPEFFGYMAETVSLGLQAGDAAEVYDTAWTAKLLSVAPGVVKPPALTLSWISARSNSAIASTIWNINRPEGVLRSRLSFRLANATP